MKDTALLTTAGYHHSRLPLPPPQYGKSGSNGRSYVPNFDLILYKPDVCPRDVDADRPKSLRCYVLEHFTPPLCDRSDLSVGLLPRGQIICCSCCVCSQVRRHPTFRRLQYFLHPKLALCSLSYLQMLKRKCSLYCLMNLILRYTGIQKEVLRTQYEHI